MVASLRGISKDTDPAQAYLFIGGSGEGKTTVARIFAEALDTKQILEYNCADKNTVDFARWIAEEAVKRIMGGGRRVFIFDEVQRLTTATQNILLKSMEDSPKNVFFIFATTDSTGLIEPFKGRCLHFQTERPERRELLNLLLKISEKEGIEVERKLLLDIVQASEKAPRMALNMLSSIANIKGDEAQRVQLRAYTHDEVQEHELGKAILAHSKWEPIAKALRGLKGDPESIRWGILASLNASFLFSATKRKIIAIDHFSISVRDSGMAGLTLAAYNTWLDCKPEVNK